MSRGLGGVHCNAYTEPNKMLDWIEHTQVPTFLALEHNAPVLAEMKRRNPKMFVVGRVYVDETEANWRLDRNPEDAARWMVEDHILPRQDKHLWDCAVGFNEPARDSAQRWRNMGIFDGEMATRLHVHGIKYGAGSQGVGHPTEVGQHPGHTPMVQLPEIRDGWSLADYILAHEYYAPRMDSAGNADPDQPSTGWFTLRYRKWYPQLDPTAQKPLIITECGVDSGAPHWPPGVPHPNGGWRSFGPSDMAAKARDYLTQIAWYESELRKDAYIKGYTVYCWGTRDPLWDSFDVWPGIMREILGTYFRDQANVPDIHDPDFQLWVAEAVQKHVTPMNPNTLFRKVQREQGWDEALSDEVYPAAGVVSQVFYTRADDKQHIIMAHTSNVHDYEVVERDN